MYSVQIEASEAAHADVFQNSVIIWTNQTTCHGLPLSLSSSFSLYIDPHCNMPSVRIWKGDHIPLTPAAGASLTTWYVRKTQHHTSQHPNVVPLSRSISLLFSLTSTLADRTPGVIRTARRWHTFTSIAWRRLAPTAHREHGERRKPSRRAVIRDHSARSIIFNICEDSALPHFGEET